MKSELPGAAAADVPIKPLRLGNHLETTSVFAGGLRCSEEQDAAWFQREMKQRHDLRLRLRAQIDQQVPAGYKIQAREWRIGQHILHREDHRGAQFRGDAIAAIFFREEAGDPVG